MSTRALAAFVLGIAACSGGSSCSGAASSGGSRSDPRSSERADAGGADPSKVILVSVAYPGASSETVEHEVAEPAEHATRACTGIRARWTMSQSDIALLGFQVEPEGDTFEVTQCLRARLDEIKRSLPADAQYPTIARSASPAFALMTVRGANASTLELRPAADRVARALDAVAGVTGTRVCGPEPETLVQIDPARARSLGVTASEVIRALTLVGASGPNLVQIQSPSIETLRKLTVRASPEVRLDDVATLSAGAAPNGCRAFDADGNEVIAIEVKGSPAAEARLAEALEPIRSELPPGLAVEVQHEKERALLEAVSLTTDEAARAVPSGLGGVALLDGSVQPARLSVWAPPAGEGAAWLARAATAFGDPARWQLTSASFSGTEARAIAFSLPADASASCIEAARTAVAKHGVTGTVRVTGGGVARDGRKERRLAIDRRRAADLGVTMSEIAQVLRIGFAGQQIGMTQPAIRVRIEGAGSPGWLDSADVAGQAGRVPLRLLIEETEAPASGVFVGIEGHDKIVIRTLLAFGARPPSASSVASEPGLDACRLEAADFAPSP